MAWECCKLRKQILKGKKTPSQKIAIETPTTAYAPNTIEVMHHYSVWLWIEATKGKKPSPSTFSNHCNTISLFVFEPLFGIIVASRMRSISHYQMEKHTPRLHTPTNCCRSLKTQSFLFNGHGCL